MAVGVAHLSLICQYQKAKKQRTTPPERRDLLVACSTIGPTIYCRTVQNRCGDTSNWSKGITRSLESKSTRHRAHDVMTRMTK